MKIAVASPDGVTISHHFGRSQCFIVFDMEDGNIAAKEIRKNTFTAHALGNCHGEHDHADHDQHHSHSSIVEALSDCDAVLCYGMGWRAAQDLAANNISAYVLDSECSPEEAAMKFAAGTLKPAGGFCRCHE